MPAADKSLRVEDFTKYTNIADEWTDIAEWFIPRGNIALFENERNIELFLATKDTFSGDGTTTTFTLTKDIVDNERLPDNFGAVVAYVDGTQTDVTVDYSANTITFASAPAAGTDNVVAYYIWKDGQVEIRVEAPAGTRGIYKTIFNDSLKKIHVVDQFDQRKPFKLYQPVVLPEDFRLVVRLKATGIVSWDDNNVITRITIPYKLMPLNEYLNNIGLTKEQLVQKVIVSFVA
jgi:hypothetical protein